MRKDQIAKRRAVNQRLADDDRKRRCAYCLLPLTGEIWISILIPGRFCSESCQGRAVELETLRAGIKC